MKLDDPLFLRADASPERILFAVATQKGSDLAQQNALLSFNDECVVLSTGVADFPHGEASVKLVSEIALWGYKQIRQRRFYWKDKKLLARRIFRSTNMTLWNKQKEEGFEGGMRASLSVLIIGPDNIWGGFVGEGGMYLFREGLIEPLVHADIDDEGHVIKALGEQRLGLVPQIISEKFIRDDVVLMVSRGVSEYIDEEELRQVLEQAGSSPDACQQAIQQLFQLSAKNGSTEDKSACLVKKIRIVPEE